MNRVTAIECKYFTKEGLNMAPLALSHHQERIWIIERLYPGTNIYNLSFAFRMGFSVDFSVLEKAINQVVETNDGLRISIEEIDGTTHSNSDVLCPV